MPIARLAVLTFPSGIQRENMRRDGPALESST